MECGVFSAAFPEGFSPTSLIVLEASAAFQTLAMLSG